MIAGMRAAGPRLWVIAAVCLSVLALPWTEADAAGGAGPVAQAPSKQGRVTAPYVGSAGEAPELVPEFPEGVVDGPPVPSASSPVEVPTAELPERIEEVVAERTATSDVWLNADGFFIRTEYSEPKYFDAGGRFELIDSTLVPDGEKGWFRSAANSWVARFGPVTAEGGGVEVTRGADRVAFTPSVQPGVVVQPQVGSGDEANVVTYLDVWKNVDIRYLVTPVGVKEDIVVKAADVSPAPPGTPTPATQTSHPSPSTPPEQSSNPSTISPAASSSRSAQVATSGPTPTSTATSPPPPPKPAPRTGPLSTTTLMGSLSPARTPTTSTPAWTTDGSVSISGQRNCAANCNLPSRWALASTHHCWGAFLRWILWRADAPMITCMYSVIPLMRPTLMVKRLDALIGVAQCVGTRGEPSTSLCSTTPAPEVYR